ncbi:hypothetical protein HMPREF0620_0164 [Parascardovia denticolens DSM 10105 = JCM 12538]|uniref:Uncharacterized protein n=1 Tax=Parascardovia denticolens DSM 10105 = JCM 12538 TaxID=864564 RepID=E6JZE4_PARDN|nr:hypothetical protein HMPREF0620_0164 [Parascardovia denticolens DSM 10105 = JCM 12538]BAR05931.1 hypothetical protein PSDT_1412 [Parascardovia denticolens DSM 10105 = JCM 12538]
MEAARDGCLHSFFSLSILYTYLLHPFFASIHPHTFRNPFQGNDDGSRMKDPNG